MLNEVSLLPASLRPALHPAHAAALFWLQQHCSGAAWTATAERLRGKGVP
jgi:hypothetical protein